MKKEEKNLTRNKDKEKQSKTGKEKQNLKKIIV